jgi:hypothetical protein
VFPEEQEDGRIFRQIVLRFQSVTIRHGGANPQDDLIKHLVLAGKGR